MTLSSKENNKALENLKDKLPEILNDRSILASYLQSPLSKIRNLEHSSEFNLVKDPQSNKVKDLLMKKTIPVTLLNNSLVFRDTNKKFEQEGDLLRMMTNKNYNVDLAFIQIIKLTTKLDSSL